MRKVPCETAIASTETLCLTSSATDFFALLDSETELVNALRSQSRRQNLH
ncbi:MAG: hypothetical protein F6K28_41765 [Microcoleus sp. SIO2G3]|nr:hypothetical protein [Microcoleus sp. SIO2G3]